MSDDQKPLRDDEREKLARDLTDSELERTPHVNKPLAVLTADQPGSGKSTIVTSMRVQGLSPRVRGSLSADFRVVMSIRPICGATIRMRALRQSR